MLSQTLLAPTSCAVGTYTNQTGQTVCQTCESGHGCSGQTQSSPCSRGYYAARGAGACSQCSSGTFSYVGQATCTPCPAGSQCPNAAQDPQLCSVGYYSGLGNTTCSLCPSGTYPTSDHTGCQQCNAGYYCPTPVAGSLQCFRAGNGQRVGSVNDFFFIGPLPCSAGTWSSNGTTVQCTTCPAGYYCPVTTNAPLSCPAGTYSAINSINCTLCPAGKPNDHATKDGFILKRRYRSCL